MPRDKKWFFGQNPYTKGLAPSSLTRLVRDSETLELRKRKSLWVPGSPANRIYFVRTGILKISKLSQSGRDLTLHQIGRNELCGEFGLVSQEKHSTIAEVFEEAILYATPAASVMEVMRNDRNLGQQITELMAERRRSLEDRIQDLLFKTAHARLAALFLDLRKRFGVRDARGIIINLKITHREMASLIGSSRETVSFALLDMRKEELILAEDKRVILIDEPGLHKLAGD